MIKRQKYYILGWYLPTLANSNFISDPKTLICGEV